MRILEYSDLDTSRFADRYRRVCDALERDDFRAAQVKKLANLRHGRFYRAKLDDANRVLFALVRLGTETCVLMLEIIEQHAYDRSRFLRGAAIDESKIPDVDAPPPASDAIELRYLHPQRRAIQYLDKPLSFDDAQDAIFHAPLPLVLVGSAGSGKTALTLERMKRVDGDVLYVTQSHFLAQGAREIYYANAFERDGQDAVFLSYREFLESLRVPAGREVQWRDFRGWCERQRQAFKGLDPHPVWEEMRGVIGADEGGVLSREAYLALGVRQSVFDAADRARVYDLFARYRSWLAEAALYDPGLVAQDWLVHAAPRYDFVVVDEVQDLTPAQLRLVLATLKQPEGFLICGDSNQIVHPNFFAWSRVKTLFWRDAGRAARQPLQVLRANFRNARRVTDVANTLLRIKHARFGSVDRESNFLVEPTGEDAGAVTLLRDEAAVLRQLDEQTRQAAGVAVLVLRDEDKAEARRHFRTPLVFAVHEAKGLEYEHIVLYRFISGCRSAYAEVAAGVGLDDLGAEALEYRRAADKSDRSLEIYKFYVNALYVALTRAIRNVYLVESDLGHPLLGLLAVGLPSQDLRIGAPASSREEWQREARRLELQGKQEQAAAVRAQLRGEAPVPWPVFDEARLRVALDRVFRDRVPGGKLRQQLREYAAAQDEPMLAGWLDYENLAAPARDRLAYLGSAPEVEGFDALRATLGRKHLAAYVARNIKDVLRQCEVHGVEHRTPMNLTPLMAAAAAGNVPLVEALLERGADPSVTDHRGHAALHWALREAIRGAAYARGPFATIYDLVAPGALDLRTEDRLVRLERHLGEYLLFQTVWALHGRSFACSRRSGGGAFDTRALLEAWEQFPPRILRPERNRRAFLSALLARNEVDRDQPYNRRLFQRSGHGRYRLNPGLAVRRTVAGEERWQPVLEALNQPLVHDMADPWLWRLASAQWAEAGHEPLPTPLVAQDWPARELAQRQALERAVESQFQRRKPRRTVPQRDAGAAAKVSAAENEGPRTRTDAVAPAPAPLPAPPPTSAPAREIAPDPASPVAAQEPKWGTPAAREAAYAALLEQQRRARQQR